MGANEIYRMKSYFSIIPGLIRGSFSKPKLKVLKFGPVTWTLNLPAGFKIFDPNQVHTIIKKLSGKKTVLSPEQLESFSNSIFLFAMDFEKNYLIARAGSTEGCTEAELREHFDSTRRQAVDALKRYYQEFARVYIEHFPETETISNIVFERSRIHARIPERIIATIFVYHAVIKGQALYITVHFTNDKGPKMLKGITESVFE